MLSPKQNENYSVYVHTNKVNGKKYVGITRQKPTRRWQNGRGYEKTYFGSAIKKYGWDRFEHEVIESGMTKEKACLREIELIEELKSNDRRHGYNVSRGGVICDCVKVRRGYEHPNHQAVKMIDPKTGEVIKVFGAQAEAARIMGINRKGITKACTGIGTATYKGYIWEYAEKKYEKPGNNGRGNYDHKKQRKKIAVIFPDGQKVVYNSKGEACETLRVPTNSAWRYLKNNTTDKEGRRWCYA